MPVTTRDAETHPTLASRVRGYVHQLRGLDEQEGRLIPRWVARVTGTGAVLLIPWSLFLVLTLPSHTVAHSWNLAWAGFDVGMALALAALAAAILRRSVWAGVLAATCGTMLLVDAWFDVTTSAPGGEQTMAIAMAVLLEIPGAVLCFATARHIGLVLLQARRYLDAAGVHLVAGRLVGPDDEVLPAGIASVDARFAAAGPPASEPSTTGGIGGSPLTDPSPLGAPGPGPTHAAPPVEG